MNILRRLFLLVFLYSGLSHADFYQAALNKVNWTFSGDNGNCVLTQDIPLYGQAEFVSKPGQRLRFSVQEQRRKPVIIKASLVVMPAPWMHQAAEGNEYTVYLDNVAASDYGRLSVYSEVAEAMLDELLQGQYPTFEYIRASSSTTVEETRVAVSSVKFAEPYKAFLACRTQGATVSIVNTSGGVSSRKRPKS